ncbi:uncharacterized protein LOC135160288 isoform X4 [Diachasmimorpha longicaudata]|uniref:uncharacterized protein LOC135160288 isoform X4 n=1 Tax=Diachasmimorpha longicaudata TaxID=58733 RepID=UPI0030B891B6
MDFWDQDYFRISKIISSLVGQWPNQSVKELFFSRGILVTLTVIQLIPRTRAVVLHSDDPEVILDAVGPFIIDTVFVIKTLTNWYNFKKMKSMLSQMKENWKIFTDSELEILHQHTAAGKRLSLIYLGSVFSGGAVFATEPLQLRLVHTFIKTNATLPLFPMPVDYGSIDVAKYYWWLFLLAEVTTFLIVFAIISCDLLFFIYSYHVFGLFAALGFADALEELYIWNFLAVVGLNMIIISVTGVQIVVNLDATEKVIQYGSLTISQLGHLFVECLLGQRLIDYSLGIQEHVSNARWYYSSVKSQKMLGLLLMRSQWPCQLTAGKFLVMNFQTFNMARRISAHIIPHEHIGFFILQIIRTSASYFTVLLATQ